VATAFMVLFLLAGVLLTLLVLIQKGRGGGLAGAFGGPGGHSAFGTQTADVLIKATAVLGALFFLLSLVTALVMTHGGSEAEERPADTAPVEPGGPAGEASPGPAAAPPRPPARPAPPAPTPGPGATDAPNP
jgi:preprotein translocase subunit SecG